MLSSPALCFSLWVGWGSCCIDLYVMHDGDIRCGLSSRALLFHGALPCCMSLYKNTTGTVLVSSLQYNSDG